MNPDYCHNLGLSNEDRTYILNVSLEGSFNLKRVSHVIMYISRFSAKMIKFKMKLVYYSYQDQPVTESDAIIYDLFCYKFSTMNKYNMIKFFCIISQ